MFENGKLDVSSFHWVF